MQNLDRNFPSMLSQKQNSNTNNKNNNPHNFAKSKAKEKDTYACFPEVVKITSSPPFNAKVSFF